jgi:hypothetical protein
MNAVKQIMDFPFTVEAPWPHANLSPNARQHPIRLGANRKRYKAACMAAFMGQGLRGMKLAEGETLNLTMTFTPPVTRAHDDDNLVGRMKAGRDALAATIGVDDSRFRLQPITILKASRIGAKVTITVERAEG